jgi:hypothetical protein
MRKPVTLLKLIFVFLFLLAPVVRPITSFYVKNGPNNPILFASETSSGSPTAFIRHVSSPHQKSSAFLGREESETARLPQGVYKTLVMLEMHSFETNRTAGVDSFSFRSPILRI